MSSIPRHAKPSDYGPAPVLDKSILDNDPPFTVLELAVLLEMAVESQERITADNSIRDMWEEAWQWRREVREAFAYRFFEVN
jgi:hypothetical protein